MAKFIKNNFYEQNNIINNSKILLLLKNKKNAELLYRFLDANYVTYKDLKAEIDFDLILTDSHNYQSNFKKIEECKNKQSPIFLPVILLHKKDDIIDYTSKNINIADEFILTPVKKEVLKNRIKRLLKTRLLTQEVYNLENKFNKIFNNINKLIMIHKVDLEKEIFHNFIEVNDKVIDILGFGQDEILEMNLKDLISSEEESMFLNYYFNKLKKYKKVKLETKLLKKDGDLLNVQLHSKQLVLRGKKNILTSLEII